MVASTPDGASSVTPLVSVVMPMFNTADLVAASIRSVQAQTATDWELLVVDDHSTDGSFAVAGELAGDDDRVRVMQNAGPKGAPGARNHAITHARGRYIAFLDSDDLWLPDKLRKQLVLARESGAPMTFTSYYKITSAESLEAADFVPNQRVVRAPARVEYRHLLRQDYIGFLTAMYDTEVLGKVFLPPIERRQDYAMVLSVLREGHVAAGLAEPLAVYRARRPGSLSTNKLTAARYNWHLYRDVERLSLPRAALAFGNYAVRGSLKWLV